MSKFHDEFFRKGSVTHDQLVELTMTSLEDIFKKRIKPEINTEYLPSYQTMIYVCGGQECSAFCKSPTIAFREKPYCEIFEKISHFDMKNCEIKKQYEYKEIKKCKHYYGQKFTENNASLVISQEYDRYLIQSKNLKCLNNKVYTAFSSAKMVDIEPEVICKNGTFIIGYADIKASFELECQLDCKIDGDWVWQKFDSETIIIDVVVECKPDLSTWGGPLRQIKTYMDIIRCNNERDLYNDRERRNEKRIVIGLFTTYSVLPEKIKELLKKENIFVATLPSEDTD